MNRALLYSYRGVTTASRRLGVHAQGALPLSPSLRSVAHPDYASAELRAVSAALGCYTPSVASLLPPLLHAGEMLASSLVNQ